MTRAAFPAKSEAWAWLETLDTRKLYTRTGVYAYSISERIPDNAVNAEGLLYGQATRAQRAQGGFELDGVRYDSTVQNVTVTVTDPNSDGSLQVDVSASGDIPTFVNEGTRRDVTAEKRWDDANDQDGLRPESIALQLMANGEKAGDTVTLIAAGGWKHTWTSLPRSDADGKAIVYTVAEPSVPDGYDSTVAGDMEKGFTITNVHTPATTQISVTKAWDDGENQDGLRPDNVTVQLKANGTDAGEAVTLSAGNSWKHTWTDLDAFEDGKAIVYTVAEPNVPDGYNSTVTGDMAKGFTITNVHVPEMTEATVKKVWDDKNDAAGKRPASLKVSLSNGESVTLNAENSWTGTLRNLPAFKDGARIEYTWTEDAVPTGYRLVDTKREGTTTTLTNRYSSDTPSTPSTPSTPRNNDPDPEDNDTPQYTNVSGQKTWRDNNDAAGIRPESITVILLRDDVEVDRRTVTAEEDEWRYTFSDLPTHDDSGKAYHYAVHEENVDGYYARINGYDIVNALLVDSNEKIFLTNYTEE